MNVRSAGVAVAFVLMLGSAGAEEHRAFRLSYDPGPGCPDAAAFSAAIQANSARIRPAHAGETSVHVEASAFPRDGGFVGELRVRQPDGTQATRSVPAGDCAEAVTAMALIVTLTIDPDAKRPDAPSGVVATSAATDPSQPLPPSANAVPEGDPVSPTQGTTEKRRDTSPVVPTERQHPAARSWQLRSGATAGLVSTIAPVLSPEFGAFVGFGSARRRLFSPFGLLSVHLARSPEVTSTEGTAQFDRVAGRFTGCPLAWYTGPVVFRPCAFFGVGELRGTGSDVSPALTATLLWMEVGVTGRGEVRLVGPLYGGVEVGATFPLVHDTFYFKPSQNVVHEVPAAGFVGAIELGLRVL